jgi:hypothetical protein
VAFTAMLLFNGGFTTAEELKAALSGSDMKWLKPRALDGGEAWNPKDLRLAS